MKLVIAIICVVLSANTYSQQAGIAQHYDFASIEYLIEQEIGRIVVPQFYQNIGISVTIAPLPADRAQHLATSGLKDGEIMRIWDYGLENPSTVRVPTPYYYLETMPFVLKKTGIEIKSADDLANYRVARVRGVKHTNKITEGLPSVYDVNSTQTMFRLLLKGKVDVALTNTIDGLVSLERMGYQDLVVPMKEPLVAFPLYHYLNQKHLALVPFIDQEIQRLQQSSELKALIQRAELEVISKK